MAQFICPLLLYASTLAKLRMQALAAAAEEERARARLSRLELGNGFVLACPFLLRHT